MLGGYPLFLKELVGPLTIHVTRIIRGDSIIPIKVYLGIEFIKDLVSKPQKTSEGLRHPCGCTNELSQTKNMIISESDLNSKRSNKLSQKKLSNIKNKSSSIMRKSKDKIPDINVNTTSRTNKSSTKVRLLPNDKISKKTMLI